MSNTINFEKLIQSSSDFITAFDDEDKIVFANKSALAALEIKYDTLVKKGLAAFIHPDDTKSIEVLKQNLKNHPNTSFYQKLRFISSSGKIRTLESNCTLDSETNTTIVISRDLQHLVSHEGMYGEAKKLANIGVWEYCVETDDLVWDDVVYDIYELNTKTDITLTRMKQFFREESLSLFKIALQRTIDNGAPIDLELNFVSGKFRPSTARFVGKLIPGKINKVIGTIQNLTDLRRLERRSEDYKEAVDKSSIVSITDRDGVITEVNQCFLEVSQYTKEELIGQSHRVVNSGFHSKEFWENVWQTISNGDVWSGEIKNKCKNNKFYWVNTTIIPFKNSMGRTYQYLAIQNDVTENKKLTEEIMVSEKLSAIGEISAQILHEVMTPLSIISLSIENLEDDVDELENSKNQTESIKSSLYEIKSNYDKIEEIFQNMRSILVAKQGADTEEISLRDTFEKSMSLVKAKITSKDVTLKLDNFTDFRVTCSRSELSQVFLNLINNAVDAIADLDSRWIEIQTKKDGDKVALLFQDSGSGIPHEIRERIFDNLFTTKGETKGTGLGMGVCKKLIERYNGEIRVAPEFPYTTFEIKLPLS